MRRLGTGVVWEGFLEVELSQILNPRKKGEREECWQGELYEKRMTPTCIFLGQGWSIWAKVAGRGTSDMARNFSCVQQL